MRTRVSTATDAVERFRGVEVAQRVAEQLHYAVQLGDEIRACSRASRDPLLSRELPAGSRGQLLHQHVGPHQQSC
jgi:hypothetical protein